MYKQGSDASTIESVREDLNPYSTSRDLTQLFYKKMGPTKSFTQPQPQPNNFLLVSAEVRKRIQNAQIRLKEFQQLAAKTGLFNDQDSKLNNSLQQVKQDLDWTQQTLESLCQNQKNDLQKAVVEFLQSQTISISNVFKKVLQEHTERVRSREDKRLKFEGRDRVVRRGQASHKMFLTQTKQNITSERSEDQNSEHSVVQIQERRVQDQSRVTQMKRIETMLSDVATVFQRIGTMVKMQETMIDRIDKYTEDAQFNVDKGRKELQSAYKRVSENRSMILKVFLILFVFSFVYIVFVV